jgi:hypothetical protein
MLSQESRRTAGILLVVLPTVIYGGVSLLGFLLDRSSGYMENPPRQNLFRAGHAHVGVLLVLSLVAIFLPAAFFFSVLSPRASQPNAFIYMAFVGAVALAIGLVTLGVGLLRAGRTASEYAFRLWSDDPQVGAIEAQLRLGLWYD